MAKQTYTTRQLIAGFGVSDMSIYTWRKGTATRRALKVAEGTGRAVAFEVSEVKKYAKEFNLKFDTVAADNALTAQKTGPKPKAVAKETKVVATKSPKKVPAKVSVATKDKKVVRKVSATLASAATA